MFKKKIHANQSRVPERGQYSRAPQETATGDCHRREPLEQGEALQVWQRCWNAGLRRNCLPGCDCGVVDVAVHSVTASVVTTVLMAGIVLSMLHLLFIST